jgi:hypothetical protein
MTPTRPKSSPIHLGNTKLSNKIIPYTTST